MTSAYRRDHAAALKNDEFTALTTSARLTIEALILSFDSYYPLPVASNGERRALERAFARYLIDSGKASVAGVVAA